MTRNNGRVVFFDFFGVVINAVFSQFIKLYASAQKDELLVSARKVDLGIISLLQFRQEIGQCADLTAEQVKQRFDELVEVNWSVVKFAEELKRQDYRIAVLSNVNGEYLREICGRLGLDKVFDRLIASSDWKRVKPERAFFRIAMGLMNCYQALLVDDTAGNVDGFVGFGQSGIVFTGDIKQLREEFQAIQRCHGF